MFLLRRLILIALLASAAMAESKPPLFDQVGPILDGLSQITGWKIEHRVPAEMLHKETFRRYMEANVKDSSPKEVRAEELTLKMFGLAPQDFKLADETVDLYSEQAAAFYDYKKKRLFVLDSTPSGEEQQVALIHELAHALADQHHRLGKYMHEGSPDDDASTARQAVMEGQAQWLTWAYLAFRNGGKAEVPPRLLDQLASAVGASGDDFPVYTKAPLYIRESLIFPYDQGTRFQDAVYRKLGQSAFDEVFEDPPLSTHQILHPDAYFSKDVPTMPEPPPLEPLLGKQAKQFRVLAEGELGEFDFSALLREYTSQKTGAAEAAHARGGAFRLYEHKHEKYPVLAYTSDWDSRQSARTYFELYKRVLKGKWKRFEIASESDSEILGTGDTGKFQVHLVGSSVQAVEGLH